MDSVMANNRHGQPKTLAELLPGLSGIVSKESMKSFSAKKQPRNTIALPRTAEKNVKVLTMAEMRANICALSVPKTKKCAPQMAMSSAKKRAWNSSVKVENKTKSHTGEGQMKNNSVRKVLNFQSKPKVANPRLTIIPESCKFPKPEFRAKKSLQVQAKNTVRISGVCKMPETPVINNKIVKNRMTLANKENVSPKIIINSKPQITPLTSKKLPAVVPDTPLSNMSWKSGSDTSFLQNEKNIQDIEEKTKVLAEEPTLENIAEVTPPVSTPFKEYRNVQDFFNNSKDSDSSAVYHDNTIMCFDKMSLCNENNVREESVIVSLCDLLNKASVTNADKPKTELNDLLEFEKQLEHNIKMVDNGINTLLNIKESQLQSLHQVKKLIDEKRNEKVTKHENNNTLIKAKSMSKLTDHEKSNEIDTVVSKPCSVIKTKSPSYKIPKKNCLRKKILYKSMPNVSEGMHTPNKDMDKRAFNMYMEMKMKEQMNFLNTPRVIHRRLEVPDTPTVTSYNLQMQLDKIYKDNT